MNTYHMYLELLPPFVMPHSCGSQNHAVISLFILHSCQWTGAKCILYYDFLMTFRNVECTLTFFFFGIDFYCINVSLIKCLVLLLEILFNLEPCWNPDEKMSNTTKRKPLELEWTSKIMKKVKKQILFYKANIYIK